MTKEQKTCAEVAEVSRLHKTLETITAQSGYFRRHKIESLVDF